MFTASFSSRIFIFPPFHWLKKSDYSSLIFRIYILLHIKKHYLIYFCCLFLKSSKAFNVSLSFSYHKINVYNYLWKSKRLNTFKVGLSPSKKNLCYLLHWKSFKNDEKRFLFHRKSSFRSQDILVFVMPFWSCRKNGLIRKIRLTSRFVTSQPG